MNRIASSDNQARPEATKSSDEASIRALIEERISAVHAKDLNALMAHHASDVLSFDVLNPLQNRGDETIRDRAAHWFAAYQSEIGYDVRDLNITAGADVAFCTYLYRVTGTLQEGGAVDMWVRATVGFHKQDGSWLIVHEHQSVPFDGETGKASLDLKP
ncbi:MAG: nuclear transport factor 2 family protein [Caldilineaceae bacterium]